MGALAQEIIMKIHDFEKREELRKEAEAAEKAVAQGHGEGKSEEDK
jgi:hypothetical protein